MKDDIAASAVKVSPAVGANAWLWLTGHDINWYVAAATLAYVLLQGYVLVRDKVLRRRPTGEESA